METESLLHQTVTDWPKASQLSDYKHALFVGKALRYLINTYFDLMFVEITKVTDSVSAKGGAKSGKLAYTN